MSDLELKIEKLIKEQILITESEAQDLATLICDLPEIKGGRVGAVVMQLLADITENKLLVRPSLVGGWWVSSWKGVTGLNEAYCKGKIGEGKTILEAVNEWKKLSKQSA